MSVFVGDRRSTCWPMPSSLESKKRSSDTVSAWPRTNWSIGESSPGIGCSAYWTVFESVYSVGL